MTAKEKAQELLQKHYGHGYVLEAALGFVHEAALITARECRQIQYSEFARWWDEVIAELEKMKNQ